MQAIPMLSRHDLEALTERLIDRLDEVDGDADLEDDDPAGQCDEDEINTVLHLKRNGLAGCALTDMDGEGEDREQSAVKAETF